MAITAATPAAAAPFANCIQKRSKPTNQMHKLRNTIDKFLKKNHGILFTGKIQRARNRVVTLEARAFACPVAKRTRPTHTPRAHLLERTDSIPTATAVLTCVKATFGTEKAEALTTRVAMTAIFMVPISLIPFELDGRRVSDRMGESEWIVG